MAPAEPEVDRQHPWLGLDSFSEETRAYFFGREEEIAELSRRVQRKLLTILFGQSGLGKTSILRAGIVPRLRPLSFCPVYVRIDYGADAPPPSEQIKAAILRATQAQGHWTQTGVAVEGESLWEFLHHRDDVLRDGSGKTLIPLLIFDQFEEMFTLAQTDDFARRRAAEFVGDLADLVENRPPRALEERMERDESAAERFDFARGDYRILIALREDYLAHLEGLKVAMPSVTQNRMRLARMTGAQALEAVQKPGGRLVNDEVAEAIVRFTAGGAELRNAEVEPALLSLVCRELNTARIAQGRDEISADVLAGSRDTILAEFYERSLADQPPGVRQVIEDHLLTESGYRESLAEERLQKLLAAAGAAPGTLEKLVDRRLLRVEERLDVRRVELTHDVLCPIVRASRDLRLEREARDEAERTLAAQRERERATRAALIRARQIAAGCAVLAVIAVGSAIYGYVSAKRAQDAEFKAQQTRQMAEAARSEAEKLVVYLLDDFYLELEPIGRLDIVAQLSRRALDYYGGLPPELRSRETERNRALALVRYGTVLRYQSKLDEGEKSLTEAIGVLTRLREQGDLSEPTTIGLGLGLLNEGRTLDSRNKRSEALRATSQAIEVLEPLVKDAQPSVAARRAYGNGLVYLGFQQLRDNDEATAVATLARARDVLRAIDRLELNDLPSAVSFAEASAWQLEALRQLGRYDEARRHADEAIGVAGRVLERRPGNMSALRARALLNSGLANIEAEELHLRKAEPLTRQAVADWEAVLRIDPTNQIAWNNLSDNRQGVAWTLLGTGRIAAALAEMRSALAVESNAVKSAAFISLPLGLSSGWLAQLSADAGLRDVAASAVAANARFAESASRDFPPGSFNHELIRGYISYYGAPGSGFGYGVYALPYTAGDFETVRRIARESAARLEQIKAPNPARELDRSSLLRMAYRTQAEAAYRLRDYADADAAIRRATKIGQTLPKRNIAERRDDANEQMLAASIAAQQGREADAQRIVEPVLAFHRGLYARGSDNDDVTQHVEYARALYVGALAGSARGKAQLKEAAAILDALPPETRRLTSTTRLRDDITEQQKRAR